MSLAARVLRRLPAVAALALAMVPGRPASAPFPDAGMAPPAGWNGPVFHLRQDYPPKLERPEQYPWLQYDFHREHEWQPYLYSVLKYCFAGNIGRDGQVRPTDWDLHYNGERGWYHAPALHLSHNQREFIHGLTHERVSEPGELSNRQQSHFQNWAVSAYNAPGGYTLGQVWHNPVHPDPNRAFFPWGTVAIKLLFTQATVKEVPYLAGAPEWPAYIYEEIRYPVRQEDHRTVQVLRLLQVDVAVKDPRARETGWVFGTFVYNGAGSTPRRGPWLRLYPVGLTWGNDPGKLPGTPLSQVWINRSPNLPPQHLGFGGRLVGPVDNPLSSCLSCHSTAQFPAKAGLVPDKGLAPGERAWMQWFSNIRAPVPFTPHSVSLDYSLQLGAGIQNVYTANRALRLEPPVTRQGHER